MNHPVSLLVGNNGCLVFCELRDMSITGARLASVPLKNVPDTFNFLIHSEDVALPCRVRWIKGTELGVEFIGEPEYRRNIFDHPKTGLSANDDPQLQWPTK
jgi:hypothetical protein